MSGIFGKVLTGVGGVTLLEDFGFGGGSSSGSSGGSSIFTSIIESPTLWEGILLVGVGYFVFRVAERKIDKFAG